MKTQRYASAEAYPTRRSLREAEKRAHKKQFGLRRDRDKKTAVAQPQPLTPRSVVDSGITLPPIPWAPVDSGEETPRGILPEEVTALPTGEKKSRITGFVPRVAILGGLAAATTVVPLNGPFGAVADQEEDIEYGASDVLDVLMETNPNGAEESDAQALAADPMVGVRAAVIASRSQEREAPTCSTQAGTANGAAAAEVATVAPEVVMPLPDGSYRVTSRYGYRSLWGRNSMHAGLDMAAPTGTPIHAIADGVVEYTGPGKAGRSSMLIIIRHEINGQSVRSWYVHMYSNGVYTTPGQQVHAGEVIGAVGSNGNSTGPHLHLEIHLDDNLTTTDPSAWLASNGAASLTQEVRDCLTQ